MLCQEELSGRDLRATRIDMVSTSPLRLITMAYSCAWSSATKQHPDCNKGKAEPCLQVGRLVRQGLYGDCHHSRNQGLMD